MAADSLIEKYENQLQQKLQVDIDHDVQEGLKSGNLGVYFINRIPVYIGTGVYLTTL